MSKPNRVCYLYDTDNHMELIFCDNSTISYPLHNHISVFTIGIVLEGSINLNINHTVHIYRKNQSFVIPPYIPHNIKADQPYSLLSLCIHKDLLNNADYDLERMKTNITNLLVGALGPERINQTLLSQLFSSLHACGDIFLAANANISDPYIDRLRKQIEMFPENKFSVEEMAHTALSSKYYFIRRFKQTVGLTPHQFQIQNRIRKAQHLIGETDTITEVALTTGFCDQSHFIKQFEKHVGLTPSAYRQSFGIFNPKAAN